MYIIPIETFSKLQQFYVLVLVTIRRCQPLQCSHGRTERRTIDRAYEYY